MRRTIILIFVLVQLSENTPESSRGTIMTAKRIHLQFAAITRNFKLLQKFQR